jgi:hypothetical protein
LKRLWDRLLGSIDGVSTMTRQKHRLIALTLSLLITHRVAAFEPDVEQWSVPVVVSTSDRTLDDLGTFSIDGPSDQAIPQQGMLGECSDYEIEENWSTIVETQPFELPPTNIYRRPSMNRWAFESDAVALTYEADRNFAIPGQSIGSTINSGDFDANFDAGMAAQLQYVLSAESFLEVGWVGNVELTSRRELVLAGGFATMDRSGDFTQFEAIYGHEFDAFGTVPFLPTRVIGLIGGGGILLDEELRSFANTRVENQLFGVTGGIRTFTALTASSSTQVNVLGGLYDAQAKLSTGSGNNGLQSLVDGFDETSGTAFAGRLSLEYQYAFNRHWFVQAGYRLHWMSGIATAGGNFDRNVGATVVSVARDEVALLHGPSLGAVWIP